MKKYRDELGGQQKLYQINPKNKQGDDLCLLLQRSLRLESTTETAESMPETIQAQIAFSKTIL